MPTLEASVVPLSWNSRHTQTSLQTVPIYSPQAAHSCRRKHTLENQPSYPPQPTAGPRFGPTNALVSTYLTGGRRVISKATFSCSCSPKENKTTLRSQTEKHRIGLKCSMKQTFMVLPGSRALRRFLIFNPLAQLFCQNAITQTNNSQEFPQ